MASQANNSFDSHTYAYLGPIGTFTEMALAQVPEAKGEEWLPVAHVQEAIDHVISGRAFRAIIPVENSTDGGVTATLDALAATDNIHIYGEYLVPVTFNLVAKPGVELADIKTVSTHPVAYAQTRKWLFEKLPHHTYVPASSTAAAAAALLDENAVADAAIAAPSITGHYQLETLAEDIGVHKHAETRFLQIGLEATEDNEHAAPARTGHDKTSVIVELPDDHPGALLEMLQQFASRGINLTRIESRPVGDRLGRYRFNLDAEGHIDDPEMAAALAGLSQLSANVVFLGSYPKAG
ncbi:prephenate dehydratase [Rhodoluna limnophila]|uniref:prephenate dehydratase n=1 Tax=Rhodoluna limnophila TaxID=232537 RepID=UPI001105F88D|nr:prephenate dehydratase [Rhodoluna limnophila]